ncbi:hypothetical protein L226DRAFT_575914 [Lentinus tigrinus ALCF2SS1-7]|uniref:Mid2 domain-containing protein n=1 Tax=Lentinus tigrinus ALCF2SS1-6 TaxID=1328759 RepID=A0A5C2S308_9APHY|nr:hypothetical protein L227DRAFT_613277 [Lentinus tigrinus ALCF2SS1-6]RPD68979.1 hypothetical protein L226DRAFT_575914 [Lentinus tigrinus ALCF2SS1-7]
MLTVTPPSDEAITVIQSQIVYSFPVIFSQPTATLFSTCPPDSGTSVPPPPPPNISTSQPSPSQPSPSQSSTSLFVSQVSSTLPGGSVVVASVTFTSTMPPTFSTVPTSLGGESSGGSNSGHGNVKDALGAIIGGAVGGFFGLIALATFTWFIWRKRDSIRALYAKEQDTKVEPTFYHRWSQPPSRSPPPDAEPKPYEYGLVGRPPSTSPPPTRPQSLAFTGLSLSPSPYSTGYPYNPPTPNSARGLSPSPSPYSPYFPQHPPSPSPKALTVPDARPHTPVRPDSTTPATSSSQSPPPQSQSDSQQEQEQPAPSFHRQSDSLTSVGTAVSYPFPVLQPVQRGGGNEDDDSSVSARHRQPFRLSLTLANWNPSTDGELFTRASSDNGREDSLDTPVGQGHGQGQGQGQRLDAEHA